MTYPEQYDRDMDRLVEQDAAYVLFVCVFSLFAASMSVGALLWIVWRFL